MRVFLPTTNKQTNKQTNSGRAAEGVVHAAVFCQQCGICLTYFIFVGTNARDLLTNLCGVAEPPSLSALCYWQLLLFVPLVMIRDIEQFTYTNMVANVAILYSVLVLSAFAASKASACSLLIAGWLAGWLAGSLTH